MSPFLRTAGASALATYALLVGALSGCGQSPPPTTGRIEDLGVVASARVGADFLISVRVPPGYDEMPTTRYPVVYQLDARFLGEFELTTGHASQLEAEGRIPRVIVVGVSRAVGEGDPGVREADFSPPPLDPGSSSRGRADLFFAFLTEELGPRIDAAYRTDPSQRVLIGHSLGGLFALYAFCRTNDDLLPYFAHLVAADPSIGNDRGVVFGYEQALAEGATGRPGSLYVTGGQHTGAGQVFFVSELARRIRSRGYADLRFDAVLLETDHGGTLSPSAEQGLLFSLGSRP